MPTITIDIDDVRKAGGVREALAKKCEGSDAVACGVIGMAFATSGPGHGWSQTFGAEDFAARALDEGCGALAYLDLDDGRVAALEDGEVVWTDESDVRIECPGVEDALAHPEVAAEMARAVRDYHHPESDVAEWKKLVVAIKAAGEAFDRLDPERFDG
jgi:hypothetical protein